MPAGVPTDEATVAAFRAHYLYSGNASQTARKLKIPMSTGREIAQKLAEEPGFVEERRVLRAIELEEHAAARREVRRISLIRFKSKTGGIDVKRFSSGEDHENVTITDKRHE